MHMQNSTISFQIAKWWKNPSVKLKNMVTVLNSLGENEILAFLVEEF